MLALLGELCFTILFSCIFQVRPSSVNYIENANGTYSIMFNQVAPNETCSTKPIQYLKIKSIITDSCILFYPTPNCSGNLAYKVVNFSENLQFMSNFQSWIPCSVENVGFNAQIYKDIEQDVHTNTEPVQKFHNICKCVHIPTTLYDHTVFLHTEAQKVLVSSRENCTGAGGSVSVYGGNIQGRSFEPFDRPLNCPR